MYMARVVDDVALYYGEALIVKKVITKQMEGAMRLGELSKEIGRPAPVPSIFINGKLVFDQTPSVEELRDYLDQFLGKSG